LSGKKGSASPIYYDSDPWTCPECGRTVTVSYLTHRNADHGGTGMSGVKGF
jgi:hypothetical protein